MNDRLNPAAINPDWGGVKILKLTTTKPDNFDEIFALLQSIVSGEKYYTVIVHDTNLRIIGEADIIKDDNGKYIIRKLSPGVSALVCYEYRFKDAGGYERVTINY